MATVKTKIELTDKDLLAIVSDAYGLDINRSRISISHYPGDQRESAYTSIIIEGEPKVKK